MKKYGVWVCALTLGVLVACGGGGANNPDSQNVNPSNNGSNVPGPTLAITAAKGAGMAGATITVTDAKGSAFLCPGTTNTDGRLSCTVPAGFTAPFVIMAQVDAEKLYSVVPTASATSVNVTPLTTVVVAGLSSNGDPAQLASDIQADATKASAEAIQVQVNALNTNLRSVIDATLGAGSQLDPLKGALQANTGTGQDKLLDTIKVSITVPDAANSVAASQVISLKADPEASVTLSKGAPASSTITPEKVTAAKTIADANPALLVADLIARMNACYALPVGDRVAKTDGSGTAADVKATACKNLFIGNDPTLFKNGGALVGAKSAFKSLFSDQATGVVFDLGNLEYVVSNPGAANDGFWVLSYRSTDKDKNIGYGIFAVKNESGVLKQAGNQYDYDTGVSSYVQDREFINDMAASYLSTGYALTVSDKIVNGASIFKQVTVTSPKGKQLLLKPTTGCSNLALVNGSKLTCTGFVRLNYGYKNPNTQGDVPALERSNHFFVPLENKYSDADLAAIPDQGTWSFKIEFADNRAPVTQLHRTLSRAPTLSELRKTVFADLSNKARADLINNTKAAGAYVFGPNEYGQLGGGNDGDYWTVPAGAAAPTSIKISGRAPSVGSASGNAFDDASTVLASARSAQIKCSRLSAADLHCDAAVAVGASGYYAAGTRVSDLQLNAFLPQNLTRSKHIAAYYPSGNGAPAPPATTKTLADFAGSYSITTNWQAKGSDGKVADSGSTVGTLQINTSGAVSACSVGSFIQCSGALTLNTNKDGVTFSVRASDGGTMSGTLSGTIDSTYALSGSFSGINTDGNYTLSGSLTGRKL